MDKHEQAFAGGNVALEKFKEEDAERMRDYKNEFIRVQTKITSTKTELTDLDGLVAKLKT